VWRAEGLVTEGAARALEERYELAKAEAGPSFLAIYVLGALLVGAGIVSLVAWHWESLAAAAKLALIGGAMIALHAAGWSLWKGGGRAPRLGHALVFLGTLVYGANVGLVAQIFHVSGPWWSGFALFAAGALAAGLVYRSLPHHLLAATLALGVAGAGYANAHAVPGLVAVHLLAALFVVLAWRVPSRALAVVTVLGAGAMLAAALEGTREGEAVPLAFAALAAACAAAPLAARGARGEHVAPAFRLVGRVGFYLVAYALSFGDLADDQRIDAWTGVVLGAVVPSLAVAAALLASGLRRADVDPLARGEAMLLAGTVAAFGVGQGLASGGGTAAVANMALVFLAVGRIVRGLSWLRRAPFWEGMAIAGVLVASRFLELETELWLKGSLFIVCGVAILGAGFAFERRRARAPEGADVHPA
jgi:uncharacterized membrane protein